jgi:hypothetical protein
MNSDAARPKNTADDDVQTVGAAPEPQRFAQAAVTTEPGLAREFLQFLIANKAWWLVPIILSLLLLGAAAWLSTSALSPFIYPLF